MWLRTGSQIWIQACLCTESKAWASHALCWVQDPIIKTGGAPPPRVPSERVKHIKEPRWEAAKRLRLKMSCCPSWELLFWAALVSPLRPGTRRDFLPLTSRNERIYSRIGGPDLNPHSIGLNRRASPGQRNQKWVQAWQQSDEAVGPDHGYWFSAWKTVSPNFPESQTGLFCYDHWTELITPGVVS